MEKSVSGKFFYFEIPSLENLLQKQQTSYHENVTLQAHSKHLEYVECAFGDSLFPYTEGEVKKKKNITRLSFFPHQHFPSEGRDRATRAMCISEIARTFGIALYCGFTCDCGRSTQLFFVYLRLFQAFRSSKEKKNKQRAEI